jgi:filamin
MAKPQSMNADEPWVAIQKRTFTNWVNIQLNARQLRVEDLETDFMDGVSLIGLCEIVAKGSVGKYNKTSPIQGGEATTNARQFARNAQANCDIAINFIKAQGVRLENVGAVDIVEGNLRIILGFVWSLILRYQLAEGNQSFKQYKEALLHWVKSVIGKDTDYGLDINNFKGDWVNGNALGALVDAFKWKSIENWAADGDALEKNTFAITTATEQLSIPGILAPQDVGLDELSLLCYLDFFYDRSKTNPPNVRPKGAGYKSSAPAVAPVLGGWRKLDAERAANAPCNVRMTWS